jgi:ABC-2 type transport system ATP-binding protein
VAPSRTGAAPAAPAAPDTEDAAERPVDPDTLVVDVRGASKRFGPVPALSSLNLAVPRGRITVLLGPNGAGKTTAIRVITGALEPDGGHVRTFGWDPARFGEEVRRRCGVVSAKPALYDRLSGWDNLRYSAELYGLGRHATARIRDAAARFGIVDALDQKVGGYSTGMKTRLALARSVLHDPELLLFDEPTSGLDPESSRAVLDLIREMTAGGRTVVMCTHLLVEAEGLADQIIVLESGTDLLHGTQDELIRRYWPNRLVWFDAEDPTQLDLLQNLPGVLAVRRQEAIEHRAHSPAPGRSTVCQVEVDHVGRVPDLLAVLVHRGVRVTRVDPHEPTLEELYFAVRAERRDGGGAFADARPGTGEDR